jgi:Mn2+/Fe2+ NRAMP family transporter
MRALLYLAAFGVVAGGAQIDPANPPASMFRTAAGELGYRFFGLVMWAAAITSVVGCTFTSVSFLKSSLMEGQGGTKPLAYFKWIAPVFIAVSVAVFLVVGRPVKTLVVAGAVNGLILPIALAAILIAARRTDWMGGYRLPPGWQIAGWLVVVVMGGMAGTVLGGLFP